MQYALDRKYLLQSYRTVVAVRKRTRATTRLLVHLIINITRIDAQSIPLAPHRVLPTDSLTSFKVAPRHFAAVNSQQSPVRIYEL